MADKFDCPVCDLKARFDENPLDRTFDICPQCGTEFGYDDAMRSHEELRAEWIAGGRKWWSDARPSPSTEPSEPKT